MNPVPASEPENPDRLTVQPVDLRQSEGVGPQSQLLHGMHETFARSLANGLSQLLQTEIKVDLTGISLTVVEDCERELPKPGCLIKMRLHPGFERAILAFEPRIVLGFLDLLLGGSATPTPSARELTEIEWSLFEEISRVLVQHLGNAWETIRPVEFIVEALMSDSSQLAYPYPSAPAQRISFKVSFGEQSDSFELIVPCSFFGVLESAQLAGIEESPVSIDIERNARLLRDCELELEIRLDVAQLTFGELSALRVGQIVKLDQAVSSPVQGLVNGAPCFKGRVLSSDGKRAFQMAQFEAV